MSSRAIRKLRGSAAEMLLNTAAAGSSDDDSSYDGEGGGADNATAAAAGASSGGTAAKARSAFAAATLLDDDSSSSEDEESSTSSKAATDEKVEDGAGVAREEGTQQQTPDAASTGPPQLKDEGGVGVGVGAAGEEKQEEDKVEEEVEEDLDAILSEFQVLDAERQQPGGGRGPASSKKKDANQDDPANGYFGVILRGLDVGDLDVDRTLRASLLGGGAGGNNNVNAPAAAQQSRRGRGQQQQLLFGPPMDGWVRPPRYVGGGMGMTTYDRIEEGDESRQLPWPYNSDECVGDPPKDAEDPSPEEAGGGRPEAAAVDWRNRRDLWYTFVHSDSHGRDCDDYRRVVRESGDLNALTMFVAHHPYVSEALLQLSAVMYQSNRSREGLALLRRCLWVHESAALIGFARDIVLATAADAGGGSGGSSSSSSSKSPTFFVDADQPENAPFFGALFALAQVSNIAGLPRTSLAASRLVLSMDPLRDPKGVLLNVDHFALATESDASDRWIADLVESDRIRIWYRDDEAGTARAPAPAREKVYSCGLRALPNWAFSYALALFRLSEEQTDGGGEARRKADTALREAVGQFPSVIGLLLKESDVETSGRSFRRDWITVLDYASSRATRQHNSWQNSGSTDPVLMSATLQAVDLIIRIFVRQSARLWSGERTLQWLYDNLKELQSTDPDGVAGPPSPALIRYCGTNPADYDNKIEQLPQDANILDPNLIHHAMNINPNLGRFVRGNNARGGMAGGDLFGFGDDRLLNPGGLLGPPTQMVNPDWPLLEVFWRSFLPWNRVEGVPPPRR